MEPLSSVKLIEALSDPTSWPHRPTTIDVVQTHISIVFLVGDRAYKIKKAVNLGFVDFTDLESRKHFCEEEVRLNRRLSPDVYLGVVPVVRDVQGRIQVNGKGEIIDYAVQMRRLPESGMMNHRLARGEIDNGILNRIAEILVEFHGRCPTGPDVDQHAQPAELRRQIEENFGEIESNVKRAEKDGGARGALTRAQYRYLRQFLLDSVHENDAVLRQRIDAGRIREGHGDLHSRNICIEEDGRIVIYDCIEFSRALRCRDVASEIAFLAMDLDFQGFPAFSEYLVRRYAELADDPGIHPLIDFYKIHYASVRGKVESLREFPSLDRGGRVTSSHDDDPHPAAGRYFRLAAGYALRPALVIMCGLPGTGKSYFASKIAPPLGAHVLRSDVIRKNLAGISPTDRGPAEGAASIYTAEWSERTYQAMFDEAIEVLRKRRSVILDATMSTRKSRRQFVQLGEELAVPTIVIQTTASDEEVRRRMRQRREDACEVSDADWSIYLKIRRNFEPPDEVEPRRRLNVRAGDDPDAFVSAVIDRLIKQVEQV